jgi:hypothetical protein
MENGLMTKKIIITNRIMVITLIVVMLGFIIGAICPLFFGKEKPTPKFRIGDMVVHSMTEREGQIVDNCFEFDRKIGKWKVKIRMKKAEESKESLAAKLLGKKASGMFNNIPETLYEFELEKQ